MSEITVDQITGPATPSTAEEEPRTHFPGTKPRMLLIVNPFATTVSGRLKNLVVYALRGRYDIEAVETQRPNHATELTRQAVGEGFDLVVSFGGDGTLNEAANGLAGLGPAAVGAARRLDQRRVPDGRHPDRRRRRDRAPAAARGRPRAPAHRHGPDQRAPLHLLQRRRHRRRRDALGRRPSAAEGARRRRDVHVRGAAQLLPRLPRHGRRSSRSRSATSASRGSARSCRTPTRTRTSARPRCESARTSRMDDGTISLTVMRRASLVMDAPGIMYRLFSRTGRLAQHRQASSFPRIQRATVRSLDGSAAAARGRRRLHRPQRRGRLRGRAGFAARNRLDARAHTMRACRTRPQPGCNSATADVDCGSSSSPVPPRRE